MGKSLNKSMSSNYGQKFLEATKKLATDALKTASKKAIQKAAEATGDMVGNKIPEKIAKAATDSTHKNPKST